MIPPYKVLFDDNSEYTKNLTLEGKQFELILQIRNRIKDAADQKIDKDGYYNILPLETRREIEANLTGLISLETFSFKSNDNPPDEVDIFDPETGQIKTDVFGPNGVNDFWQFRERYGFDFDQNVVEVLNSSYYNQTARLRVEDDVFGKLMGSILRNRSWDAFIDGSKDRLDYFDIRNPGDPVITFGFNTKLNPKFHQIIKQNEFYLNEAYQQSLQDYNYHLGNWTALNATEDLDDDKTYGLRNYSDFNATV